MESWKEHKYLVEWVNSIQDWASEFEIYAFVKADETGEDPTGQIPSMMLTGEFPIDTRFVWTVFDSSSEVCITSEFSTGNGSSAGVLGWFLGKVPHNDKLIVHDYMKRVCALCEGQGYYLNADQEEEECEACLENSEHIWLPDTGFKIS